MDLAWIPMAFKINLILLMAFTVSALALAPISLDPPETCNLHLWYDPPGELQKNCAGACEAKTPFPLDACGQVPIGEVDGATLYACDCVGSSIEFPKACKATYAEVNGELVWIPPYAGCVNECDDAAATCVEIAIMSVPNAPATATACSKCDGQW